MKRTISQAIEYISVYFNGKKIKYYGAVFQIEESEVQPDNIFAVSVGNDGVQQLKFLRGFKLLASVYAQNESEEGVHVIAFTSQTDDDGYNAYGEDSIFYNQTNAVLQNTDFEIYEKLIPVNGASVLELGCGTGRLCKACFALVNEYVGIDKSSRMLSQAISDHLADPISFLLGDMIKVNGLGKFDFIVCGFNTLQHCNDLAEVNSFFKNADGLLKVGGRLIVDIFNPCFDFLTTEKTTEFKLKFYYEQLQTYISLYETHWYDSNTHINYIDYLYLSENEDRKWTGKYSMLQIFADEIDKIIKETGFKTVKKYGDYSLNGFTPSSTKQIFLLKKLSETE